ncbi:hypothetical protein QOZ80_4AG0307410 [Eleusine coracana subsp. coracana]|nr:hypothetical protein QOZ80_4AG0307410 [Eleusine coracana subsp. coracana]
MGCKGSKLDDQEAVALCRARAELLAAAVRHRYALADAHAALAASINAVAAPLHSILLLLLLRAHNRLELPSDRKRGNRRRPSDPSRPPRSSSHHSHLEFGSPSGSDPADDSPPRPVVVPEPLQQHPHFAASFGYGYAPPQPAFAYPPPPGSQLQFYYARSRPPPPSVAVAQRAPRPVAERAYYGSFDAAASGHPQPQYHHAAGYGAQPTAPQRASTPPSPPKASAWDFLNVFENYDSYGADDAYYASTAAAYTPSRSSREVREEEGIPDLEDDDEEEEDADVVVKQVSGEYSAGHGSSRRSSVGGASSGVAEFDAPENVTIAHTQDLVMGDDARRRSLAQRNVSVPTPAPPPVQRAVGGNADVAGEIKAQLARAADAARELAPLLEVGRPSYQGHNSSVYHSSSRIVSAISASHLGCKDMDLLDVGLMEKMADSLTLSSTLEKLYFWERKLYSEVKAEEKMRLLIVKNSKRLKLLDQRGSEPQKIDATRNLLRKLSTKIRISVRVIAKISKKINRVRDEELWPQVNVLIVGFVKMWQDKLDSYQSQCQVISEVKNLNSVDSGGSSRDLAIELELELIKWIINFSSWVSAQRNFAKALNGWLALCLNYEPEEACNGASSYSPGMSGTNGSSSILNKANKSLQFEKGKNGPGFWKGRHRILTRRLMN